VLCLYCNYRLAVLPFCILHVHANHLSLCAFNSKNKDNLLTYLCFLPVRPSVRVCPVEVILAVAVLFWGLGRGAQAPRNRGQAPKFSRPQIVARPPNLAVLLTHCDQLILRKISKFDATRCQILRLKCTKFDFRWGSAPDP